MWRLRTFELCDFISEALKYSNCIINPSEYLEENQKICLHHYHQAHLVHYFDQEQMQLLTIHCRI